MNTRKALIQFDLRGVKKKVCTSEWLGKGGVVKVEIYEVDTKIALYVDTFWLQL